MLHLSIIYKISLYYDKMIKCIDVYEICDGHPYIVVKRLF